MGMVFPQLFAKPKPRLYVVVDVGSHLIRALIFEERQKGSTPRIVKKLVIKLPATYHKERIFIRLRELLFATIKELGRIPEKIIIAFGPHLVKHALNAWSVSRLSGQKKLTRRDFKSYFRNLFEQNQSKEFSFYAYPQNLLINGYPVDVREVESGGRPLTDARAEVDLSFKSLGLEFSPEVGKILADMKDSLGGMPIEYTPLVLAIKEAVTRVLGVQDVLLVDVGGEETTLIFLRAKEISEVSRFSRGARHFLRKIAGAVSISFEEAEDLKRQYVQGLVPEGKKKELGELLKEEADLWKKMFGEALTPFYKTGPLPAGVMLFGGGAHLPEITDILKDAEWFRKFSHLSAPELKTLNGNALFAGDTCSGFIKGPEDVGLASLMIYATFHEPIF